MSTGRTFRELLELARKSIAYKAEGVILDVTEQIVERMERLSLSKAALASKIGSSAPYVTKMLRGGTNFTIESMVKVSEGLECELKVQLVPKVTPQDWLNLIEEQTTTPAKAEYRIWSRVKGDSRMDGGNLTHVKCPYPPQLSYQQSS